VLRLRPRNGVRGLLQAQRALCADAVSGRDGCGSVLVLGVLEEANRLGLLRTVGPA
jgi:hypothetical protein